MKKLRLLFALLTLTFGWTNASAQTWTTGQEVGAGTFYLYNVGAGKYLNAGDPASGWGTHSYLTSNFGFDVVLAGSDGKYTIDTNISNGGDSHFLAANCWTDGGAVSWEFTDVTVEGFTNAYTISTGGSFLVAGTDDSYGGTTVLTATEVTDNNGYWLLVSKADMINNIKNTATKTNPVDATFLVKSANFDRNDIRGAWTQTHSGGNFTFMGKKQESWGSQSFVDAGNSKFYGIEAYGNSYEIKQTINALPAGTYEFTCQGFDNGDYTSYIYAGSTEKAFVVTSPGTAALGEALENIANGQYTGNTTGTFNISEDDASIEIGFKRPNSGSWAVIDNARLIYYGLDLSQFEEELAAAVAAAEAVEGTIPPAAYEVLANVVSENNKSYTSAADYSAAIANINAALSTARAMVDPYAAYIAEKANATFAGVATATINEQDAVVAAATKAADIEAAVTALKAAINALTFDITSFTIKNAAAQSKTDWEGTDFGGQSDGVTEYWSVSPAGFYQTVSLPAGKYRMTVVALQRTNMTGTVYAGENSTIIAQVPSSTANNRGQAASWFNAGNGRNYVYFELDQETDVVVGLKVDETTGDHWTVWQGFTLETFDESVAADYLAPGFAELVEAAQATHDDAAYANVIGSEKSALETAIAAEPSTIAEYDAAVQALNDAVAAFIAAKTNYDIYAKERALADAISTDITVAAPTTAAEALTQFRALKVAEYNYVATAYPFSATSKIGEFSTWDRSGSVNGNTNVTFEALTSQHWSGKAMTYYEQPAGGWDANGAKFTANYEKSCKLPAGSYVVKVAARAATGTATTAKITCSAATLEGPIFNFGDTGKGITTAGVASFDEGTFCNDGNGRGWVWNYLPFTLTEETTVTMTVVAVADGVKQWFSVCDGELLSKENIATAVEYDETATNTIEDVDVANVTIARGIKADYNTVVLPFDLTANQVQTVFGSGTEVYAFSENSANPMDATINFNKVVAGTISANVPVLVKATTASTEQVFEGVQVVAAESAVVEGTNFDFVGTYAPITVAEGDYFIGNGALYKSAGATSMKAFRAYINAKTTATGAKVNLFIDGIATSIREINGATANESGDVFNIVGQRVKKAQKGLYIINGKKVLVK